MSIVNLLENLRNAKNAIGKTKRTSQGLIDKGASGIGQYTNRVNPADSTLTTMTKTLDTADVDLSLSDTPMSNQEKEAALNVATSGEEILNQELPDPERLLTTEINASEVNVNNQLSEQSTVNETDSVDNILNEEYGEDNVNSVSSEHIPNHEIVYRDNYRVPDIYDSTGQYTTENGERLVFPDYIASEIERAHNMFTSKDVKARVYQLHDEVHGLYKSHMLFKKIPYHLRNLTDNLFWRSLFLAENYNVNNYEMAHNFAKMTKKTASEIAEIDDEIGVIAGRLPSELYERAVELRVLNPSVVADTFGETKDGMPLEQIERLKHWSRGIVGDTVADAVGTVKDLALYPGAKVRDAGAALQEATENVFRTSLWLDRIRKGDSDKEALRYVNKIFFDYNDLSNLEKNLGKRMFSWYTFHAKNTPLQLSWKLDRRKVVPYAHAMTNLSRSTDAEVDTRYMAEFMKGAMPIKVRTTPNGDTEFFLLGSWISDVRFKNVQPSDWGKMALSQLNPFIKKPTEFLFNYDSFRNKPLEKYPGETTSTLGLRTRKRGGLHNLMLSYYADISMLSQLNKLNPFSAWGKAPKAKYQGGAQVITDPGKAPTSLGKNIPLYDETSAIGRGYDRPAHQRFLYLFVGGSLFAYDRATSKSIEYNKFNSKYFPGVDVLRGWFDAFEGIPDKQYGRAKFRRGVAVKTGAYKVLRETEKAMNDLKLMEIP